MIAYLRNNITIEVLEVVYVEGENRVLYMLYNRHLIQRRVSICSPGIR
jgi:hypothetical protein